MATAMLAALSSRSLVDGVPPVCGHKPSRKGPCGARSGGVPPANEPIPSEPAGSRYAFPHPIPAHGGGRWPWATRDGGVRAARRGRRRRDHDRASDARVVGRRRLLLRRGGPRWGRRSAAALFDADRCRRSLDFARRDGLWGHVVQVTARPVSHASVWTTIRTPRAPESRDIVRTLAEFSSRRAWWR
jgi:hypothetical protein